MSGRGRLLVLLALGAGLLPALAAARVLAPGSDATIAAKSFWVEEKAAGAKYGKVGSASVTCPSGSSAVGGGVGTTGATSPRFGYVQASGPLDESGATASTVDGDVARSWYASVYNSGPRRALKVFAICSPSAEATIAASSFSVASGNVGGSHATCPAGSWAVGGGVGTTADTSPPFGHVQVSGPVDETRLTANTESGERARGWYASVYKWSSKADFKVFAVCSRTVEATIAAASFQVEKDQLGDDVATCPSGSWALGGGVGATGDTSRSFGELQASGPLDETGGTAGTVDGDTARSWYASVYNTGPTREFKVFAICARQAVPPPAKALCARKEATIVGTPGADTLQGTPAADVIAGLAGNDKVSALAGDDTVCGGDGNDILLGGNGKDALFGGKGNDTLRGGPARDALTGGPGRNTVQQ